MPDETSPLLNIPGNDLVQGGPIPGEAIESSPVAPVAGLDATGAPLPTSVSDIATAAQAPEELPMEEPPAKRSMAEGFSAMSEVRRAKKEHASARDKLAKLQAEIDADNQTLEHRRQIERDYESIVADQNAAIDAANEAISQLQDQLIQANDSVATLQRQLKDLEATHEKDLAPYKDLADSAKKRADADQNAYNGARKTARTAEKHLKDLTKRRDNALDQAKRTIQDTTSQAAKLKDRLTDLSASPEENAAEIAKVQAEIEAQDAQRAQAQAKLQSIPEETAGAIQTAQQTLNSAKRQAADAKAAQEASRSEADGKIDEYKALRNQYRDEEHDLADQVSAAQKQAKGLQDQLNAEQRNLAQAQALLEEAEAIHATPEETESLANKVADNNAAASVQQQQVEALARTEQEVRARTRQSRVRLIVTLIIIAVVVIAIIWAIVQFT